MTCKAWHWAAMLMIGIAGISAAASAADQPERRPGARPGEGRQQPVARLEQMRTRVMEILNEEKKTKAEPLFAKAKEALEDAQKELQKPDAPRREIMEKVMKTFSDLRTQLEAMLTEEQKQKLRESMPMMAGPFERIRDAAAKLDLSAEQKEKIEKVLSDARDKLAKLRENPQANREAMRSLFQEVRTKIGEILTPEQREKIREVLEPRGGGARGGRRPGGGEQR